MRATLYYKTLTSMLHWKEDSASFMVAHLDAIFNEVCKTKKSSDNGTKLVHVLITEEADLCLTASLGLNLRIRLCWLSLRDWQLNAS